MSHVSVKMMQFVSKMVAPINKFFIVAEDLISSRA